MPRLAPAAPLLALAVSSAVSAAVVDVQVAGSDGKPLADAVVWLESRELRAAVRPAAGAEVAQVERRFDPRAIVVPVGTAVSFPNRDKVRHHVYSLSPTKPFELKLYIGTPANPVVFDKPGVAVLGCNIHDQMVAWVVVVESNAYGQSGRDGRVRLPDVPAGAYRLRSWHPELPTGAPALEQAVAVPAGGLQTKAVLPVAAGGG